MRITMLWLSAALVLPTTLAAQIEPKTRPPSTVRQTDGVRPPAAQIRISNRAAVGETAPGFELTSASGTPVKFSRYRGDRVLLMFAERREEFSPFRAVAESLRADSVLLVGVCRESPRSLRLLAQRDSLRFELLSDPTGEVAAIYGAFDSANGTTFPGYVLVGRQGIVRMVVLGQTLPPEHLLQLTRYTLVGL
jgi:peroxiredoxin